MHITASKLYYYLQCKHRVSKDVYGSQVEKISERILLYNEDDCKATMILKDGLGELSK